MNEMTTIMCPKCGSADLTKGTVGYDGCITDQERYGESQAWSHEGYQCKVCKTKFTVWEDDDEFTDGNK